MWFNRNKQRNDTAVESSPLGRVEIEMQKHASKEAVEKAKQANAHLKELLVENGFTLKIYLAAHSSAKPKTKGRD